MEIGDVVTIATNTSIFDCCQGKRGRIAHVGVRGGWLLCTDHFCPVERSEEELTLVPVEVLAGEVIESAGKSIADAYRKFDTEALEDAAGRGDRTAWAILVERGLPL